ncbi:MAG: hypothetical protein WDM85_10455 [Caulobacteraceae bacterium]
MAPGLINRRRALQASGSPRWRPSPRPGPRRRTPTRSSASSRSATGPRWGVPPDGGGGADGRDGELGETPPSSSRSATTSTRDGVASVNDPKWRTSFEDVYTAPSLQVPWYVALGNPRLPRRGPGPAGLRQDLEALEHAGPLVWSLSDQRHGKGRVGVDLFVLDTSRSSPPTTPTGRRR